MRLRSLKAEIEHLQLLVENAAAGMTRDFDAWRVSVLIVVPTAVLWASNSCAHVAGRGCSLLGPAPTRMPGQRWPSWHATWSQQLHRWHACGITACCLP